MATFHVMGFWVEDDAGFKLWLYGQIQQAKGRLRAVHPERLKGYRCRGGLDRLYHELWPWRVNEYPGGYAVLADLLGMSRSSIRKAREGKQVLGKDKRERVIWWTREKARRLTAIADELQAEHDAIEAKRRANPFSTINDPGKKALAAHARESRWPKKDDPDREAPP